MIPLIIVVLGVIVLAVLQIWKERARENKRLASNIQICVIVVTCFFAIAKSVADYVEASGASARKITSNLSSPPLADAPQKVSPKSDTSAAVGPTVTPTDQLQQHSSPTTGIQPEKRRTVSGTSPSPELTPCVSPESIMPDEIVARFWDTSLESYDKGSYLSALSGVCVDWTLGFWSAERMRSAPDEMFVSLVSNKDSGAPSILAPAYVYFRVPYKTHERLPLLRHNRRVRVKGQIEQVGGQGAIRSKDVTVEVVE